MVLLFVKLLVVVLLNMVLQVGVLLFVLLFAVVLLFVLLLSPDCYAFVRVLRNMVLLAVFYGLWCYLLWSYWLLCFL